MGGRGGGVQGGVEEAAQGFAGAVLMSPFRSHAGRCCRLQACQHLSLMFFVTHVLCHGPQAIRSAHTCRTQSPTRCNN